MLLNVLLVFHIIVCILLIITVLMQQSEGGALGMGGGPSGFMTARGAGNLLTRITWSLFAVFLLLSIGLTVLAGHERAASSLGNRNIESIDPNAAQQKAPTVPTAPLGGDTTDLGLPAAAPATAPAQPAPQQ